MSAELKPCPFCGEEASLYEYPFCDIIKCDNPACPATVSVSQSHPYADHTKQHVLIEAWNRRANEVWHAVAGE